MSGAVPNSRNPGCTVQKSISDNLPFLEFGSGTLAGPQSTKNSRAQGNPRAVRSSIQHTPPWLERRDPNQNTLIPASTTPFPFSGTSLCQFTGVFKLITTSLGSSFVRCHFSSARCVVTVRSLTDRPASVCQRSIALGPRLACRESLTTGNQSINQLLHRTRWHHFSVASAETLGFPLPTSPYILYNLILLCSPVCQQKVQTAPQFFFSRPKLTWATRGSWKMCRG
ncbi:hypothetical protein DER44DRAFT_348471 [Fusarium oxysporum]|nr:hypothetical protein DER44DRAFT_348471 [Fusarium oxysporum]